MKTKFAIPIFLGIITFVFIYITTAFLIPNSNQITTVNLPPSNNTNDFLIGSLNTGSLNNFSYMTDSLGYNFWHMYPGWEVVGGKHYPNGWTSNDKLFTDNTYIGEVESYMNNITNNHGLKILMQRPKIEYLCYGQRSDYWCADKTLIDDNNYWFYTFQSPNHPGTDEIDQRAGYSGSHYVRHCTPGSYSPTNNLVVSRLRSNTEQCSRSYGFDAYRWDSECDWHIKPRIRIDSNYANNPINWNAIVCRVIIIDQMMDTLKKFNIKVHNFLDEYDVYDGKYREEYRLFTGEDSLLIHGDWRGNDPEPKNGFAARGDEAEQNWFNHSDIQVQWFGNCDMWIDYVRVDNEIADGLLMPGLQFSLYDNWIKEAVNSGYLTIMKINLSMFKFANLPCIKYVEKKMKEYSNGKFAMIY